MKRSDKARLNKIIKAAVGKSLTGIAIEGDVDEGYHLMLKFDGGFTIKVTPISNDDSRVYINDQCFACGDYD